MRGGVSPTAIKVEISMIPMDIDTLYPLVTEAIRKAEVLEELGAPGARDAYLNVSLLEEQIARLIPASDEAGAIARRGAIGAAIDAREFQRAEELIAQYSIEIPLDAPLRRDLEELKSEAENQRVQGAHHLSVFFPAAFARYGGPAIQQFVLAFHDQGAPLPIR